MLHALETLKRLQRKSWQRYHQTMTNSHIRKGLIFFTISAKIALFTCALPMMYVLSIDIKSMQILKQILRIYNEISFQDFQRSRAFLYLNEIKRRFLAVYGPGAQTAIAYAMNTEFGHVLANEMVVLKVIMYILKHCFHIRLTLYVSFL